MALCMVFIVLFCSTGGLIAWNIVRKISYEHVRSHRNELKFRDTIVVSPQTIKGNAELSWIEHDEIRYHGQMYDIKKQITLTDGSIMLVGHYDDWDNQLFTSLETLLGSDPGQHPPKERRAFFWLPDAVMPHDQPFSIEYRDFIVRHFSKYDQLFQPKYRPDVPCPPPDVV
jgi:hypothetical protein